MEVVSKMDFGVRVLGRYSVCTSLESMQNIIFLRLSEH